MTLELYCRECAPEAQTPDSEPTKPTESTVLNAKTAPFIQYLKYYAETIAASPELQAEIETKVQTKVFREANCRAIKKFLEDPKYEPINMQPLGPHKVIISRKPVADKNVSNTPQYPVSYDVFEASLNQKTTTETEPTTPSFFRR